MARNPKSSPDAEQPAATELPRTRIINALMALAADMPWSDISITQIAQRADVTLAQFREIFPSKGAILAAYSRSIDAQVLADNGKDMADEPPKERLFDVLMRRLDAMAPHKAGLQGVVRWARRDPLAALALNQVAINSMRFMLEAAGIDSEGPLGALKLQGLVLAWTRVLDVWFKDEDSGLAASMAALDRELTRGSQFVARAEDAGRLFAPLGSFAQALCDTRKTMGARMRQRYSDRDGDAQEAGAGI